MLKRADDLAMLTVLDAGTPVALGTLWHETAVLVFTRHFG